MIIDCAFRFYFSGLSYLNFQHYAYLDTIEKLNSWNGSMPINPHYILVFLLTPCNNTKNG